MKPFQSSLVPLGVFGRDVMLERLWHHLYSNTPLNRSILIVGPSGIGKTAFLNAFRAFLESKSNLGFVLWFSFDSLPDSNNTVNRQLLVQILDQLIAKQADHSMTGLLNHLASLPLSERCIRALSLLKPELKIENQSTYSSALERVAKGRNIDLQGHFSEAAFESISSFLLATTIEFLSVEGHDALILLDRIDATPSNFSSQLLEAITISSQWRFVCACNNETTDGIRSAHIFEVGFSQRGGTVWLMPELDLPSLRDWSRSIGRRLHGDNLRSALKECAGRPLFLKVWLSGYRPSSLQSTPGQLSGFYKDRLRQLTRPSEMLLSCFSLCPAGTQFSEIYCKDVIFELCGNIDINQSLNELVELQMVIRKSEGQDSLTEIAHEFIWSFCAKRLSVSRRKTLATTLLAIKTIRCPAEDSVNQMFCNLVLSSHAGDHDYIRQFSEKTFLDLKARGAVSGARQIALLARKSSLACGDGVCTMKASLWLASIHHHEGEYALGLKELLFVTSVRVPALLMAHHKLMEGKLLLRLNRYERAKTTLGKAKKIFSRVPDRLGLVEVEITLNTVLRDVGQYSAAVDQAQLALTTSHSCLANDELHAKCLMACARSFALSGNSKGAIRAGKDALKLSIIVGQPRLIGNAHFTLGEAYRHASTRDRGKLNKAIEHYSTSQRISRRISDVDCFLWSTFCIADAHGLIGDFSRAILQLDILKPWLDRNALRHPLEFLNWKFLSDVMSFMLKKNTRIAPAILKKYESLGIEWPMVYARQLYSSKGIPHPAPF